jgi:hypothetical protein
VSYNRSRVCSLPCKSRKTRAFKQVHAQNMRFAGVNLCIMVQPALTARGHSCMDLVKLPRGQLSTRSCTACHYFELQHA